MLHIVLVEPEIPANTGNIARTCAVTGCCLHLIRPPGLRYLGQGPQTGRGWITGTWWTSACTTIWTTSSRKTAFRRCGACPPKRPAPIPRRNFMMAPISSSARKPRACLRISWLNHRNCCLRIPMRPQARSLNLSNSVAITVFEALRQLDFPHLQEWGTMTDWDTPQP